MKKIRRDRSECVCACVALALDHGQSVLSVCTKCVTSENKNRLRNLVGYDVRETKTWTLSRNIGVSFSTANIKSQKKRRKSEREIYYLFTFWGISFVRFRHSALVLFFHSLSLIFFLRLSALSIRFRHGLHLLSDFHFDSGSDESFLCCHVRVFFSLMLLCFPFQLFSQVALHTFLFNK